MSLVHWLLGRVSLAHMISCVVAPNMVCYINGKVPVPFACHLGPLLPLDGCCINASYWICRYVVLEMYMSPNIRFAFSCYTRGVLSISSLESELRSLTWYDSKIRVFSVALRFFNLASPSPWTDLLGSPPRATTHATLPQPACHPRRCALAATSALHPEQTSTRLSITTRECFVLDVVAVIS
jgi:hypothetical protein